MFLSLVQYAFNIFSHNAPVLENGYNEEEMKMVKETRKIWVSVCLIGLNSEQLL
jgi:aspartate-semialdehyde dehydrogenase